jgi:hypothetical protein
LPKNIDLNLVIFIGDRKNNLAFYNKFKDMDEPEFGYERVICTLEAGKEEDMKRFTIFLFIAIALTSCATLQNPATLGHVKEDLDCIRYEKGLDWKQISEKFGNPDIVPLPEPGTDLSKNTRIYKDKVIIFYIERQEVKEGEKVRFHEVLTDIELCKEK